MTELRKQN